jgi:hypothetical protein
MPAPYQFGRQHQPYNGQQFSLNMSQGGWAYFVLGTSADGHERGGFKSIDQAGEAAEQWIDQWLDNGGDSQAAEPPIEH